MIFIVTYENTKLRPYTVLDEVGRELFIFEINSRKLIDIVTLQHSYYQLNDVLLNCDYKPIHHLISEMFQRGHIFDWSSLPEEKLPEGIDQ